MATRMKKTEQVEEPIVETDKKETITEATGITADDIIKSILNNTNSVNNNTHSKRYVLCKSVTSGGLNINCKSGNVYEFKNYGYDCEIEYDDLVVLVRKHSDHIFMPRFVIVDEDFLAEFPQVASVYEHVYSESELNDVFALPVNQMMATIKSMPVNIQKTLQSMVATKIANGSIDSVKKIRALSEFYNSDFNLLSELFN